MLALPNENVFVYTSYHNNVFPTTILAYLVTQNSSVTAVYIEVIAYIKYQILILHQD